MRGQFKVTIEAVDPSTKTQVKATRQFGIPNSDNKFRSVPGDLLENSRKMVNEQVDHMTLPVLQAFFTNINLQEELEKKKEGK